MNIDDVCACLRTISGEVTEARGWLIELDTALGDGDLGITMARGFSAVAENCEEFGSGDIGKLMVESGMVFNRVSSSTMGTLISTAFLRAGKALMGKTELENEDIVSCLEAGIGGIKTRGKSERGDKTIIDSLEPAVERLKEGLSQGKTLLEAWTSAAEAAKQGFEGTREMESKAGRARWFGEKSIGKLDPGAGLGMVIWEAVLKHMEAEGQ